MQEFLDSVRRGEFGVPICISCSKVAWPPSSICGKCYSPTRLQKIGTAGTIIEFASSKISNKNGIFGVIEINGLRLVGRLKCERPRIGSAVEMIQCGIGDDGSPFYDFA